MPKKMEPEVRERALRLLETRGGGLRVADRGGVGHRQAARSG